MQTIKISEIKIEDRQRQEFREDKLNDLSQSIQKKGLLHPIVLQNDRQTLVAGERRCRAIQLLYDLEISITHNGSAIPQGHIPYVTLQELSQDDIVEAELEENTLREDLTWQEQASAFSKLHALRSSQNPSQTIKNTAEEVVGKENWTPHQTTKVSEALVLSEHLDDPEISKAKSSKEALKLVKKKKEAELTKKLSESFDISKTPHIFNHGDFREHAQLIETESVSVICTDPPYGIGADTFGDQAGTTHEYDDTLEYFKEIINAFVIEATRVARPSAHLYAFCDPRKFDYISAICRRFGWDVWPTPLIWNKGNGMLPKPDYGPRRTYEYILFANRGGKKVRYVAADVISVPGIPTPRFGAEKPPAVYGDLLRRSAYPGDLIWDPFAGAGPIFAAANDQNLRVVASEFIREKYEYAKLRLDEVQKDNIQDLMA